MALTKNKVKAEAPEKKKGEVIDLQEKVVVYSTDKDPHHETGSAFKVHPKVAERLIKDKLATEDEPAPEKGKKGEKEDK